MANTPTPSLQDFMAAPDAPAAATPAPTPTQSTAVDTSSSGMPSLTDFLAAPETPTSGSQTPTNPATTPLSAKPIPDQPAPARQRQEFLRKVGGGSTTEQGVSEANKTAAVTGAGIVASEGADAVLGKLLGPTVKVVSKGTGILDEAGNEIMREVETKGPSLAKQGITKAAEAIKPAVDFAKAHPIASTISASVLEGLAHELGIDPFELAKKAVKIGTHIVGE